MCVCVWEGGGGACVCVSVWVCVQCIFDKLTGLIAVSFPGVLSCCSSSATTALSAELTELSSPPGRHVVDHHAALHLMCRMRLTSFSLTHACTHSHHTHTHTHTQRLPISSPPPPTCYCQQVGCGDQALQVCEGPSSMGLPCWNGSCSQGPEHGRGGLCCHQ